MSYCVHIAVDLGRGNPVEHFPSGFKQADHTFRRAVLKELSKSSGNYVVFINCELGTAPEHSISTEPVDSKQFPFPQSFLLYFLFVCLFICFYPAKIPNSKSSKPRYYHNYL